MLYNPQLSNILNQDIYTQGNFVYIAYGNNTHLVGSLNTAIPQLKLAVSNFINA